MPPLLQQSSDSQWRKTISARLGAGAAELATTATRGFLYVPTCNGVPTGVPEVQAGMAPLVVDRANNRLYFYSTGAWRNAGP